MIRRQASASFTVTEGEWSEYLCLWLDKRLYSSSVLLNIVSSDSARLNVSVATEEQTGVSGQIEIEVGATDWCNLHCLRTFVFPSTSIWVRRSRRR